MKDDLHYEVSDKMLKRIEARNAFKKFIADADSFIHNMDVYNKEKYGIEPPTEKERIEGRLEQIEEMRKDSGNPNLLSDCEAHNREALYKLTLREDSGF